MDSGLPLFDYDAKERGDGMIVSGWFTAIKQFATETEKDKLTRIMFQDSSYILKGIDEVVFIFQISERMPDDYADYVINLIASKFLNLYKSEIKTFSGDISPFRKFEPICKQIMEDCGVSITNVLLDTMQKMNINAWGLYSKDYKPLIVLAEAPNYNIDSFSIYAVLGKNLQKIFGKICGEYRGSSYHLTQNGNIVQTIVLPNAIIAVDMEIDSFDYTIIKKFKILTYDETIELLSNTFEQDKTEIYGSRVLSRNLNGGLAVNHKILYDLFKSADEGLDYLFNSHLLLQFLSSSKCTNVIIKLSNRMAFLDFKDETNASEIFQKLKKLFDTELT